MEGFDGLRLDSQLCFPLYAASREVIKRYRPYLDEVDLTYTQYITMMVLWEEESVSVKRLGERLYLDSGTLTPLLRSLEKKGYVSRKRDSGDERVLTVSFTDKGRELKERCASIPSSIGSCFELSPEEALTLYRLLYRILGKQEK